MGGIGVWLVVCVCGWWVIGGGWLECLFHLLIPSPRPSRRSLSLPPQTHKPTPTPTHTYTYTHKTPSNQTPHSCDRETFRRVSVYLDFIRRRGAGETMTTAAWMRKFVTSHPEYQVGD